MLKKAFVALLLFFLSARLAYSQCASSQGVPVVNEDFGAGSATYGPQLPAGTTNLQYTTSCPADGQYAITQSSSGCYSASWHGATDHTGNPNGYFMLVNASYAPSDFFVQTVNGLCSGTSYQFSAWILNIVSANGEILPNVTFTIEKTDGTILATYNSGDIPVTNPYKWQQYGLTFKTPLGVSSVVIRMHNNAAGGIGNDLGLDDITFTPIGPSVNILVNGASSGAQNAVCNQKVTLAATVGSCYVNNAYQWQFSPDKVNWVDMPGANTTTFSFSISNSGTYYYRLGVAENGNIGSVGCRTNSGIITINYTGAPTSGNATASICSSSVYVGPSGKAYSNAGTFVDTLKSKFGCDSIYTTINLSVKPRSFSSVSVAICPGQSYAGHTVAGTYVDTLVAANGCDSIRTLNLSVFPVPNLGGDKTICAGDSVTLYPGAFAKYLWPDGSTNSHFTTKIAGSYKVIVTNITGCTSADSVMVNVVNCSLPNLPNAFTPNGDGINDTWNVATLQYFPQCIVNIYSRWGANVYHSIGYAVAWDGRYKGKPLPDGTYYYIIDLHNGSPVLSGSITIIR